MVPRVLKPERGKKNTLQTIKQGIKVRYMIQHVHQIDGLIKAPN